jgi:hypothetical protein
LTHDHAFYPYWIGNIAVRMLFDQNLDSFHDPTLNKGQFQ